MNRTSRFLVWFSIQTRLVQCFTVAILLHTLVGCILGTIKLATVIRTTPPFQPFGGGIVDGEPAATPIDGGSGGQPTPVPGPPGISPGPVAAPSQPTPAGPRSLIGVENDFGRHAGNDVLTKLYPLSPTMPANVGTSLTGGKPGGSGNPFYKTRFNIEVGGPAGTGRATKESEGAVLAALRWLRDHQESDGSWRCSRNSPATSGLALLAFLAHGETADSKDFGDAVGRGLGFLVRSIDTNGIVPGKNMYAQAIVTLALCEGYALTQSPALRVPAERAAQVLIAAQNAPKSSPQHTGGWRYSPTSADADTSVSGWVIMALQAAAHAGITVPSDTFTKATAYLWRMQGKDGFGYSAPGDAPGTTAIATFCLQFLGHAGDARLKGALDLLKRQKVSWEESTGSFVLYGWYYTTLAMFQGGGSHWESWNKQIAHTLLAAQAADGSWPPPPRSGGEAAFTGTPTYSTALGAMILETYYRYQPQYLSGKKKAG